MPSHNPNKYTVYKVKLAEDIAKKDKKKVSKSIFVKTDKSKKSMLTPKQENIAVKKRKKPVKKESSETFSESEKDFDKPMTVSTDDEDSEDDYECPFCNQSHSTDRAGEKWIICTKCRIWCHEECAGTIDYKSYICDFYSNG